MKNVALKSKKTTAKLTTAISSPWLSSLIEENNKTLTENSAPTLKSTFNYIVDLFSIGGALRGRSESDILQLFVKAFSEDKLLAIKLLFHIRNVRGGYGERRTFRIILKWLGENYPNIIARNIDNIAIFGRYDDYFCLIGTKAERFVLNYLKKIINTDYHNIFVGNNNITLCAKWLPSINASSKTTINLAKLICKSWNISFSHYRKKLSYLRKTIDIVESKMCAEKWSKIKYSTIPSKASLNYRKAFYRHDEIRYSKFLENVKSGKQKINSRALFPYEIYLQAIKDLNGQDTALDVLWDSLPNYFGDKHASILPVADVSLSMRNMEGLPMATSVSLAIYLAERNNGIFKDYFITYSEKPVLQKIIGANIREKIRCVESQRHVNTNIQAVFDLILSVSINNNLTQKDLPEQILIISDMEFDNPQNGPKTNHEEIKRKFEEHGYKVPCLVYWNVNSKQNNVPATANKDGVLLVSGASPSVMLSLLSREDLTPLSQTLKTLNGEMYKKIVL